MCGIAGILGSSVQPPRTEEVAAMAEVLHHRGPDARAVHRQGPVALGHARLSIIDPVGGQQPFVDREAQLALVFNGEVFNYLELRDQLRRRGFAFRTASDTEVVLRAYQAYGPAFVDHLNGQFAIALWDGREQELLLARDRTGIAPLYYTREGERWLFASEIKALLPMLNGAPRPNLRALDQIFTFWAPVSPTTMFEGIYEVPPGHRLRIRDGRLHTEQYWDWRFPTDGGYRGETADCLAEELHEHLEEAVRLRLRADVPVAAYLSGGLDSSAITALVAGQGVPLKTFSVGFEQGEYDESAHQRAMIEHLRADHHSVRCTPEAIGAGLAHMVWRSEQPLLRTAPVPLGMLSAAVHDQGYRVVLTGEGADEVFGGYDIFKETKIRAFWARQPQSAIRPLLLRRLYPYMRMTQAQPYLERFFGQSLDRAAETLFSHLPRWSTTARCKGFFAEGLGDALREQGVDAIAELQRGLPPEMAQWDAFARAQYLEAKLLLPGYLLSAQGDRMLTAHSVEGRFPFLDHRLIEFAAALPPRLKMRGLNEKYLLKRALQGKLPPAIQRRHKQPYRAPDGSVVRAALNNEAIRDLLAPDVLRRYGYFDTKRVQLLCRKAEAGRTLSARDQMAMVGVFSTQLWHHMFLDGYQAGKARAKNLKDDNLRLAEGV